MRINRIGQGVIAVATIFDGLWIRPVAEPGDLGEVVDLQPGRCPTVRFGSRITDCWPDDEVVAVPARA